LCPRADASQLLPIPVGPHRIKFSWASIQPHVLSQHLTQGNPCDAL
jgi:hypothetical protein